MTRTAICDLRTCLWHSSTFIVSLEYLQRTGYDRYGNLDYAEYAQVPRSNTTRCVFTVYPLLFGTLSDTQLCVVAYDIARLSGLFSLDLVVCSDQGTIRSKEPMVDTMVDTMGLPTGRMVLIHIMGSMDHILNMQPSPSGKGEICDTEAIVNSHKGVGQ